MKILFLVPYPREGASNRIRIGQYLPYLEARGVKCKIRPFANTRFYKILYFHGKYLEKAIWLVICTVNRILDIVRAVNYDLVVIHREAYPLGGPFFETIIHKLGKTIVFDFDDAIFLPSTSDENTWIEKFKRPEKVSKIIGMSALVIAGNDYLKDYALRFNTNVVVIPSPVDTDKYKPREEKIRSGKDVVIGWVGSNTTRRFLSLIGDVFDRLEKENANIKFQIVGAKFERPGKAKIINKEWSLESEAADIADFDIGIMPMPENEWTKGKCGFKALLYMACGIPVVASPVGVNLKIIEDGISGFLPRGDDEWVKVLSMLIQNASLREEVGSRGRSKVLEGYSLKANAPVFCNKLVETFQKATS